MKRFLLTLTVLIVLAFSTSFACGASLVTDERIAADTLYNFGLFYGTGKNEDGTPIYSLDKFPTRAEATIMFVRLLGKEQEAKNGSWKTPFKDVSSSAKQYIGYAYENKLTMGISAKEFGSQKSVDAWQYITFVLRALGYQDGTDFQIKHPWILSDKIGLTDGSYNDNTVLFDRGDVAIISCNALNVKMKGSSLTLYESLCKSGVIHADTNVKSINIDKLVYQARGRAFSGSKKLPLYYVCLNDGKTLCTGIGTSGLGRIAQIAFEDFKVVENGGAKTIEFNDNTSAGSDVSTGCYHYTTSKTATHYIYKYEFSNGKTLTIRSNIKTNEKSCDELRMLGRFLIVQDVLDYLDIEKTVEITTDSGSTKMELL